MQKKKRKLNYINIFRFLLGILGFIIVISDLKIVLFGGCRWTWFGFGTFLLSAYFMIDLFWMFIVEGKVCRR